MVEKQQLPWGILSQVVASHPTSEAYLLLEYETGLLIEEYNMPVAVTFQNLTSPHPPLFRMVLHLSVVPQTLDTKSTHVASLLTKYEAQQMYTV